MNYDKSFIYFSSNASDKERAMVDKELGVHCYLDPKILGSSHGY